jgi:hypothetical protein
MLLVKKGSTPIENRGAADGAFCGKPQSWRRCRQSAMYYDVSEMSNDVSTMYCYERPCALMFKNGQRCGRCAVLIDVSEAFRFELYYSWRDLNWHKAIIKELSKSV